MRNCNIEEVIVSGTALGGKSAKKFDKPVVVPHCPMCEDLHANALPPAVAFRFAIQRLDAGNVELGRRIAFAA